MAQQPHPDDPYRVRNPSRPNLGDDDPQYEAGLERDLQMDPELAEGPAGGSRIALFALGVALVLGALFYALNNSSTHQSPSSTAQNAAPATAQNAAPTTPPAAPPGMRDVTPRANTDPGLTTGNAPEPPSPPQAPAGPAKASPTNNPPANR